LIRIRVMSRSPAVKTGLEALLSSRFEIVDESADVLITDEPAGGWAEDAVVVALTHDLTQIPLLLNAGARAVLNIEATANELGAAIEAAAAGLIAIPADSATPALAPIRERVTATLTPREHQVLNMIASGLANKEIAYRLGVAESTVKFHVASIMTKLDAGSRTEAVAIGIRQGIVAL
jgi:DNA-binding NarL/FixJ family response regulator